MQTAIAVLIVDDSRVSRMILHSALLDMHPKWSFYEADGGEKAVKLALEQRPDLIVLDVNMPGMDGFTAAELIKKEWPESNIVMLTSNIQDSSYKRAEELDVGFVEKPVDPKSIRKILTYLEERS